MIEKKDRNMELFAKKLGLPPYTREHTYRELADEYKLSEGFVQRKVRLYKLKYPDLWTHKTKKS